MKKKILKTTSIIAACSLLLELFVPLAAYALTSGPQQPEFTSFEPVATTNMVDDFTGQFTYNLPVLSIPGPDGAGYSMSLSYHSGVTPEEEASWVGYGWTLNPGAIVRNKRGLPDDYNGSEVTYWNKVEPNETVSAYATSNFEAFSIGTDAIGLALTAGIRYNNYKGFGTFSSFSLSKAGLGSLGFGFSDGDTDFRFNVSVGSILSGSDKEPDQEKNKGVNENELESIEAIVGLPVEETPQQAIERRKKPLGSRLGNIGMQTLPADPPPSVVTPYTGESYDFSVSAEGIPIVIPAGVEIGLGGTKSVQTNIPERKLQVYGYQYSGNAGAEDVMDYSVEKSNPYRKKSDYLGIPFSSADNYSLTGEGLAGGFRLHSKYAGHFRPNRVESHTSLFNLSPEVQFGSNFGAGGRVSLGGQDLKIDRWDDEGLNDAYAFGVENYDEDEPYYFRFTNDLGGSIDYGATDAPVSAWLSKNVLSYLSDDTPPHVPNAEVAHVANNGDRSGRSTYIGYSTNAEMEMELQQTHGSTVVSNYYRSYNKDAATRDLVDRAGIEDRIGEFAITNDNGLQYVYGLPVYARDEYDVAYGLGDVSSGDIEKNHIVYKRVAPHTAEVVVGQKSPEPYATSYLLTEITTPDYVDRTYDGPTDDDFGGYTKFTYDRAAGATDKDDPLNYKEWFKWRTPYRGLLYNRNDLSDPKDDKGSFNAGFKELYFLQTVETKTHIAIFVTNKTEYKVDTDGDGNLEEESIFAQGSLNEADPNLTYFEREDGYEAVSGKHTAAGDRSATTAYDRDKQAENHNRKLEKIMLYARDEDGLPGELLQTVHFEYFDGNESLCKNLPNSFSQAGKLTLKRVWFEYEGVVNAQISPYEFVYEYPQASEFDLISPAIGAKYPDIISYASEMTLNDQNPDYSPFLMDTWGFYQHDGAQKHSALFPWTDQSPPASFDPAAWHLKRIILPSGGEILVQYEQHDYTHVQDREALAMVPLLNVLDSKGKIDNDGDNSFYFLDCTALGITDQSEKEQLRDLIDKRFVQGGEMIYFKLLYALIGDNPQLHRCNSDYIKGYARVRNVTMQQRGSSGPQEIRVELGDGANEIPWRVCQDYVTAHKAGMVGAHGECGGYSGGLHTSDNVEDVVQALFARLGNTFAGPFINCLEINPEDSYLRVPLTRAKKGGGVRVKRLLMFDSGLEMVGMERPDAGLYGTEYAYVTEDGASSGVATNEPMSGREENALVKIIDAEEAAQIEDDNLIIAGEEIFQWEGPLGESILPAPSIGYSRVVIRNIHKGKTSPGYAINEYHTARDFPWDHYLGKAEGRATDWTEIDANPNWLVIPGGVIEYHRTNISMTQGYRFLQHAIHGRPKQLATWGGDYDDHKDRYLSSAQVFEYFKPGDPVPMLHAPGDIRDGYPGKETEVVFDSRHVSDITRKGVIEIDASLGLAGFVPIPFVTAFPMFAYSEARLRSHVTSKVVRYPAIVKSVLTMRDGIWSKTENVAFDPASGQPVATKTADGFNGLELPDPMAFPNPFSIHESYVHTYQFPAWQQYPSMGQIALGERGRLASNDDVSIGFVHNSDGDPHVRFSFSGPDVRCNLLDIFAAGDLIEVYAAAETALRGVYSVESVQGSIIHLLPVSFLEATSGTGMMLADIHIVRSGRTNQLKASAGSLTTMNSLDGSLVNGAHDPARIAFKDALNTALNAQSGAVTVTAPVDVVDPDGQCITLSDGSTLEFSYDIAANEFMLRSKWSDNPITDYSIYPHPLVEDLNAWLDAVWALEIDATLPISCANLFVCDDGQVAGEDYFTKVNSASQECIFEHVDQETGLDDILNKHYLIRNQARQGSDFIFPAGNMAYMVDIPNAKARQSGRVFRFEGGGPMDYWGILGQTQTYYNCTYDDWVNNNCDDCRNYSVLNSWPDHPNDNHKAWIDMPGPSGFRFFDANTDPDPVVQANANNLALHNVYDKANGPYTQVYARFAIDSEGWLVFRPIETDGYDWFDHGGTLPNDDFRIMQLYDECVDNVCCDFTACLGGSFELDPYTSELLYVNNSPTGCSQCADAPVTCLDFCPDTYIEQTAGNVLAAGALTFSDDWVYEPNDFGAFVAGTNVYERSLRGKWRPHETYVYRTDIVHGGGMDDPNEQNPPERVYNSGAYTDFTLFNWRDPSQNGSKWLRLNTVTQYSPHGLALEEKNILNIYSAARFGHENTVPIMVAQNAHYESVNFQSFEGYNYDAPDNLVTAHTGRVSYEIHNGGTAEPLLSLTANDEIVRSGLSIKAWVRTTYNTLSIGQNHHEPLIHTYVSSTGTSFPMTKVAQSGQWSLYEATVAGNRFSSGDGILLGFNHTLPPEEQIWIDDIRAQPVDAQATCYVYDEATLRLIAQFDDQHFGVMYQYNGEGRLTRILRETEGGLKTVQETQYNTAYEDPPMGSLPSGSGGTGSIDARTQDLGGDDRRRFEKTRRSAYARTALREVNTKLGSLERERAALLQKQAVDAQNAAKVSDDALAAERERLDNLDGEIESLQRQRKAFLKSYRDMLDPQSDIGALQRRLDSLGTHSFSRSFE